MSMLSNLCLPSTHDSGVTALSPFAHFKSSFNYPVGLMSSPGSRVPQMCQQLYSYTGV